MEKKNKKSNITYIILVIIVILLLIFNLVIYLKKFAKPNQEKEINSSNSQNITKQEVEKKAESQKTIPKTDEEIKKYLSTLGEGNRMEYYCGQFIKYIDEGQYEKAYSLLYDEFKDNYFPTIHEFEEYVKNFYPKFFAVVYDDIDRYNDTYVIRLKIVDYKANESDEQKIQRIVIREYSYNNYKISFSVETDKIQKNTNNNYNYENSKIIIN